MKDNEYLRKDLLEALSEAVASSRWEDVQKYAKQLAEIEKEEWLK